jgi:hypothetical protein
MTTMMPDIFGNYGPDPMLQRPQAGLASLLNPIREFVTRQPRPEVDQLMQDIQGRITEFMGSPVGPPNNIFEEPMPSRPMLGIPDQLLSASPEKEPLQVKTNLDPSLEFSNKTVDLYEKFDMNRPLEAIASQQNMFRIPQAIPGLPSIFR